MNRFSSGDERMVAQMRNVAPRIHTYADLQREFLALAEQAGKTNRELEAAGFLRAAEFFMSPTDPAKQPTRFIELMKESYSVGDSMRSAVPYQSGTLSAYRFQPRQPKGTLVMFGGYDSYIEELFFMTSYFRDAGYDVICFDGPGQGAVLEDEHLPMTPEWKKPVKAVLDYFHLDDVSLFGYSLGGCLVIRAAAYEPRIRRVIADDIFADAWACFLRYVQLNPAVQAQLTHLLDGGDAKGVNTLLEQHSHTMMAFGVDDFYTCS